MKEILVFTAWCLLFLCLYETKAADVASEPPISPLSTGFRNPPNEARPRAYWNWLNGSVSLSGLTRDLEEAKEKGLLKADLTATGCAGHSGYPERFDSALDRLIRGIQHLQTRAWIDHDSAGGTTLNVHIKHGGDAYNKVPGFAQAGLFFRLDRPQETIKRQVNDALRYALGRGYVEEIDGRYRIRWKWFRTITRFLSRRHLLASPYQ